MSIFSLLFHPLEKKNFPLLRTEFYYAYSRSQLYAAIATTFGFILWVLGQETCFDKKILLFVSEEVCKTKKLVGIFGVIVLIVLEIFLAIGFLLKAKLMVVSNKYGSVKEVFRYSGIVWEIIGEMSICACQPYFSLGENGVNTKWANVFNCVILVRVYIYVRVLRLYSPMYIHQREILESMNPSAKLLKHFEVSYAVFMKVVFNIYSLYLLPLAFVLLVVIGGFCLHILERQYIVNFETGEIIFAPYLNGGAFPLNFSPSKFETYDQSLWCALISVTTVGYGDVVALSNEGRIFSGIIIICGLITSSLLVSTLASFLAPSQFQDAVIKWIENKSSRESERTVAAMIIQKFYRICKEKKLRAIQKHHGKMPSSVEIKLSSVRRSRSLNLNSSDNLEKSKLSKFHRGEFYELDALFRRLRRIQCDRILDQFYAKSQNDVESSSDLVFLKTSLDKLTSENILFKSALEKMSERLEKLDEALTRHRKPKEDETLQLLFETKFQKIFEKIEKVEKMVEDKSENSKDMKVAISLLQNMILQKNSPN